MRSLARSDSAKRSAAPGSIATALVATGCEPGSRFAITVDSATEPALARRAATVPSEGLDEWIAWWDGQEASA